MKNPTSSGKELSILLLTHTPENADLVKKTLAHVYPGVEVEALADEKEIPERKASILIVDTKAVSGAPLEHLLERGHDTPVILLVGDFSEVRHFSHLLSGRRSIVTRQDLSGMGLIQGVHHLLERQQLHEQLQRTSKHLKEISIRDDLTRLYNHHHFEEILSAEMKKANRYKRPLGLVIVAIKNFTAINESLGHDSGDRILVKAADMIRSAVREVDIPTRYGDNEFAVILPESDESAASVVARRIQESLASITAPREGDLVHIVTSCGIAALGDQIQTKDDLLRTALGALLEAKRNGSNAICTSGEITARRRVVRANRHLIEQLSERLSRLSAEAERGYFQSVMKAIGEVGAVKKLLMPHSERVAFFAQRLAESCGLGGAEARAVHRAGLLHDAGKLAIDPEILVKPAKLTSAEQDLMKQHPLFAVQILSPAPFFTALLSAILHHHERIDGTGYPEGISGDSISPAARILAIAEAWDTMITAQPYRPEPLSLDAALKELSDGAGTQFDAELVERFTGLIAG